MNTGNFLIYSLAVFILGVAIALRISWIEPETKLPRNLPLAFIATVKTEPRISDKNQIIEVADARVYVDLFPRFRVGDRLKVIGEADEYGNIYRAQVERVGEVSGNWSLVFGLRNQISSNIKSLLPAREATLVTGTVLGVDDIDREFRDQLIKTGTIHVVVVSGQNLMIVAGVFLALTKYLGRRLVLILSIVGVFSYAILTGFEPPVIRASLMVLASSLAIFFGREVWPILNIFIAALVIIFIWPGAAGEISFQLTFAAILGIATLGQKLTNVSAMFKTKSEYRNPKSETNKNVQNSKSKTVSNLGHLNLNIVSSFVLRISSLLIQNAAIAISAYIFTAPIILFYFGQISPIAPIVNILIAEAVFPIMVLGFLTAILSLIFMPLAQLLAYFVFAPAYYFVKVIDLFSEIPVDQINLEKGNILIVICFYILVFGLTSLLKRNSKSKYLNSK